METIKEKSLDILRELIIINNDRYEGYRTASEELNDVSFKAIHAELSLQSTRFSAELRKLIPPNELAPENDETKFFGDFYSSWMSIKSALAENDNSAILLLCKFSEDIIQKTYDDYIIDVDIASEVSSLVKKQRKELDKSYDLLKAFQKII